MEQEIPPTPSVSSSKILQESANIFRDGQPHLVRATIHVRPGTHHIRFIVDGVMQCSKALPTTVDFGNNLVNYIEVSADDIPLDVPTAIQAPGAPVEGVEGLPDAQAKLTPKPESEVNEEEGEDPKAPRPPKTKPVLPPERYSSHIPQYLVDLDKAEDSTAYQYAAAAIEKLPTPPSLPGFLGKPILNAATPMKDDNSVLTMPNHTVLNHLATSSIKNNVLAVSATTRYKRKVRENLNSRSDDAEQGVSMLPRSCTNQPERTEKFGLGMFARNRGMGRHSLSPCVRDLDVES